MTDVLMIDDLVRSSDRFDIKAGLAAETRGAELRAASAGAVAVIWRYGKRAYPNGPDWVPVVTAPSSGPRPGPESVALPPVRYAVSAYRIRIQSPTAFGRFISRAVVATVTRT